MVTRTLKKSIYDYLKTSTYDVYEFTRVPKGASFPYVTYNLDTSIESLRDSDKDIDFTINIDILDYKENKDSTVIDGMLDTINDLVNRADIIEDTFYYRIERQTILTQLPTPNEHTLRRQLSCVLHFIERS